MYGSFHPAMQYDGAEQKMRELHREAEARRLAVASRQPSLRRLIPSLNLLGSRQTEAQPVRANTTQTFKKIATA